MAEPSTKQWAILSPEDVSNLLPQLQALLRMQDWQIQVSIERRWDHSQGTYSHPQGNCTWCMKSRSAYIRILAEEDYPKECHWPQDMFETLVHELLHAKFGCINTERHLPPDSTDDDEFEFAIDSTSIAICSLFRRVYELESPEASR